MEPPVLQRRFKLRFKKNLEDGFCPRTAVPNFLEKYIASSACVPGIRESYPMASKVEEITLKVRQIETRNPVYTELAQWVGDLLTTTVKASETFRTSAPNLVPEKVPATWYQGKPLFNPEELSLDWEPVKNLYRELVQQLKARPEGLRQIEGLEQALVEGPDGTPILMRAVLSSDLNAIEATAKELKIDPPVLALLLHLSMRPALLAAAQAAKSRLDLTKWHYGHCPVCGSAPRLADLSGEGGKRTLHCSLCETAWPYVRLRCPFCENENRKDLSYLKAENEDYLRVDLCSRCGQYLKTIDLRELPGAIILPLDDVATWHLDLIAQENLEDQGSKQSLIT